MVAVNEYTLEYRMPAIIRGVYFFFLIQTRVTATPIRQKRDHSADIYSQCSRVPLSVCSGVSHCIFVRARC